MSRRKKDLARQAKVRRLCARWAPPQIAPEQGLAEILQSLRDAPNLDAREAIVRWVMSNCDICTQLRAKNCARTLQVAAMPGAC